MAKFGDFVKYNGLIYKVTAVSSDDIPTYTLEPTRYTSEAVTKTVSTGRTIYKLVPSGGSNLASIAGSDIDVVSYGSAIAKSLADGIVRVSFDSNDGTDVDYQDIDSGGVATEPTDPTKEGYTFDAWYYDDTTFVNAVDFTEDTFDDETVLYANWTEDE